MVPRSVLCACGSERSCQPLHRSRHAPLCAREQPSVIIVLCALRSWVRAAGEAYAGGCRGSASVARLCLAPRFVLCAHGSERPGQPLPVFPGLPLGALCSWFRATMPAAGEAYAVECRESASVARLFVDPRSVLSAPGSERSSQPLPVFPALPLYALRSVGQRDPASHSTGPHMLSCVLESSSGGVAQLHTATHAHKRASCIFRSWSPA